MPVVEGPKRFDISCECRLDEFRIARGQSLLPSMLADEPLLIRLVLSWTAIERRNSMKRDQKLCSAMRKPGSRFRGASVLLPGPGCCHFSSREDG